MCISVFQERKVYNEEYDVRIFRLLMAASKIGDMDTLRGFVFFPHFLNLCCIVSRVRSDVYIYMYIGVKL